MALQFFSILLFLLEISKEPIFPLRDEKWIGLIPHLDFVFQDQDRF